MSFFKKITETAKTTANTLGSKSVELVGMGKLKLQETQLEGNMKDKKVEIGNLIYNAYKNDSEPDKDTLMTYINEALEIDKELCNIKEKINNNQTSKEKCPNCENEVEADTAFCGNCGQKIVKEAGKICSECGQKNKEDAKFCSSCGKGL